MAKKTQYEILYLMSGRTTGHFGSEFQAVKYLKKRGFRPLNTPKKCRKVYLKARDDRLAIVRRSKY